MKQSSKKGFGLLEVMVAAVVLGFLIVGLTRLQIGNREAILRVRVRDVANNIAQEVIDSIAAYGAASVKAGQCSRENDESDDLCRSHVFNKGQQTESKVDFDVTINVKNIDEKQILKNESHYEDPDPSRIEQHDFAKNIDVTVTWKFKNTDQSINLSAVVR